MIGVDVSDLLAAADDLRAAAGRLVGEVKPVVAKAAVNVKATMRADLEGSRHFRQVARAVSYDTRAGATWAEAEVGPVTAGATVGDLAHIAYFGGARGGGNTVRDPLEAAKLERPAFEANIAALVDRLRL